MLNREDKIRGVLNHYKDDTKYRLILEVHLQDYFKRVDAVKKAPITGDLKYIKRAHNIREVAIGKTEQKIIVYIQDLVLNKVKQAKNRRASMAVNIEIYQDRLEELVELDKRLRSLNQVDAIIRNKEAILNIMEV